MKNIIKSLLVLITLYILFTVIYFAIPYSHFNEDVFVLIYVVTTVSFIVQGYPIYLYFKKSNNLKSKFYGIPLYLVSLIYLISQLVFAFIACIVNAFCKFPTWLSIVIPVLLLGMTFIGFITTSSYKEELEKMDRKIIADTNFIDNLKSDIKAFNSTFKYDDLKKEMNSLLEMIYYSDPVSNEKLNLIEDDIDKNYISLKDAYFNDDIDRVAMQIKVLKSLIQERNIRCKSEK